MVTKITSPVTPLEVIDKINEVIDDKQDTLVSGTNIKTINNTSILGSGNIDIQGGSSYTAGDGINITNNVISVDGVQVSEVELATVATSGSYNDLSNKPTIPTVNNATLTITQGGTTKGTFTANASSNVTIDLDSGGGSSRNIGEIVQSTIPLTDAGLHLLDGALISGSGSYADFVTYIAGLVSSYPDLFCSESDWQSAVTNYGVCGKFVYDSTNQTVRLPKYNSKIYTGGGTAAARGNGMTLGMTDGTETFGICNNLISAHDQLVAYQSLYDKNVGTAYTQTPQPIRGAGMGVTTDATKSGIIADLSTITTSLDGYWYIVIATSTKTDIEVDIDEIATDLNGKADVDLTNASGKSGLRRLVDVYNNGTSWYKVFQEYDKSTGNLIGNWCEQGGVNIGTGALQTTTFLKQFSSTNYVLHCINHENSTTAWSNRFGFNKTETGFTNANNTGVSWDWQACGYIN